MNPNEFSGISLAFSTVFSVVRLFSVSVCNLKSCEVSLGIAELLLLFFGNSSFSFKSIQANISLYDSIYVYKTACDVRTL